MLHLFHKWGKWQQRDSNTYADTRINFRFCTVCNKLQQEWANL